MPGIDADPILDELPAMAVHASGDGTKALFGDGTFKVPSGGGGGGNTITLTADTNIAAGTSASIDSNGNAVQTWGPAPQLASTVALFNGATANADGMATLVLGENNFVSFQYGVGAQAASIADGEISLGTMDTSGPSAGTFIQGPGNSTPSAVALTDSLYVMAGNFSSGNAAVAAASVGGGNAITPGAAVALAAQASGASAGASFFSLTKLTGSLFAIAYILADSSAWIAFGSVGGETITLGTPVELTSNSASVWPVVATLGSASVFVAFCDGNNSSQLTGAVATVSGVTATIHDTATVSQINSFSAISLVALTATQVVMATTNDQGLVAAAITDGTAVGFGAVSTVLNMGNNPYLYLLSASGFLALNGGTGVGPYQASISGTTIDVTLPPPNIGGYLAAIVDITLFGPIAVLTSELWMFTDTANSIYEGSASGISPEVEHPLLLSGSSYWLYPLSATLALATLIDLAGVAHARLVNANPINSSLPVGFVAEACSEGDQCTITVSGSCPGFSGLSPGTQYYKNGDGSVVTANTGHPAGVALSSSELLIAA
jgi:hypothetical protein